jgi:hypothetical protein
MNGNNNTRNNNGQTNRMKPRNRNDQRGANKDARNESNNDNRNNNSINAYKNSKSIQRKNIPGKFGTPKNSITTESKSLSKPSFSKNILQPNVADHSASIKNDSNNFEVKFFGSLLKNPDAFGFQKKQHRTHKVPKYLLQENVLFDMSTFRKNDWDINNQQMLIQREATFSGEPQLLFEEFQEYRKVERERMEKFNLVDKENAKKSLDEAIIFRGSCEDMCPTYERVERVFKNQVSKWEKDPNTNKISRNLALKTFMRPSGQAPPLPSDVRSPDVLQKTLNYIIENLLPKLPESQSFIWDRTRSIRQDFTFQNNYSGFESIDCHEKICRIHILSLHVMAGANDPDYQQQQEVEQFNNSLQTLTHMYDDVRSRGGVCPNEAEFRAYELISKMKDTELDRYLQTLPSYIMDEQIIQRAMMLRNLVFEGLGSLNYFAEFFDAVLDETKTPFLLASLAEIHFNEIRYNALRAVSRVYHSKSKRLPSVDELITMLGFNDTSQLMETCKVYGLPIINDTETNIMRINVVALKSSFKMSQKQPYTKRIDEMINGMSMSAIVNSGKVNTNLNLKQPQSLEEIARGSFKASKQNSDYIEEIFKHTIKMKVTHENFNRTTSTLTTSINNNLPLNSSATVLEEKELQNINPLEFKQTDKTFSTPSFFMNNEQRLNENRLKSNSFFPSTLRNEQSFPPANVFENENIDSNKLSSKFVTSDVVQETNKPKISVNKTQPSMPKELPAIVDLTTKKLIENSLFDQEALKVVDKLLADSVKNLSSIIIKKTIDNELKRRKTQKKEKLVSTITNDLFSAFMKEQVYLAIQEGKADHVYHKNLKHYIIGNILKTAKNLLLKKQFIEAQNNEIEKFNNGVVSSIILPNIQVNQNKSFIKPFSTYNSISHISKTFSDVNPNYDLNGTIILRFPGSIVSEWVLNQLGIKTPASTVEIKSNNGHKLNLDVLPDNFDAKNYFRNISTVIIQVGTIDNIDRPDKSSLINCLNRDSKVLKKLKKYLKQYSLSACFSIIIVYVDSFKNKLSFNEIKKILNLERLSSSGITLGFFAVDNTLVTGTNSISCVQKLQSDFNKILLTVWKKMYLRSDNKLTKISDSINCVDKTSLNSTAANSESQSFSVINGNISTHDDSKLKVPSSSIKKRLNYLENAINFSRLKRRKYGNSTNKNVTLLINGSRNNTHLDITADTTADASERHSQNNSRIGGFNNSLMMLRNYRDSTINATINDSTDALNDPKMRNKINELSELDELADSVLNS